MNMCKQCELQQRLNKSVCDKMTQYLERPFTSHNVDAVIILINHIDILKQEVIRLCKENNLHSNLEQRKQPYVNI